MIKIYRDNIIDALSWLADHEFQKVAWFPNNQRIMASYNENVMWVFDDTGLSDALNAGHIVFGKAADDALRELEFITNKIDGRNYSESELINLPQMQEIRQKAARALFLVQTSTGEGSTVRILNAGEE